MKLRVNATSERKVYSSWDAFGKKIKALPYPKTGGGWARRIAKNLPPGNIEGVKYILSPMERLYLEEGIAIMFRCIRGGVSDEQ